MKYDWKQLEKEYILSDYKSVSSFLKSKGIKRNGSVQQAVKGWKKKRVQKEFKKSSKTIEKVIEKESEKEAQQIVDIKSIANDLALNIIQANKELNQHIVRNKTKTKRITYDLFTSKVATEEIEEKENVDSYISLIDRQGLKQLSSALKDLNDILNNKQDENSGESLADAIQKAYENKVGDK